MDLTFFYDMGTTKECLKPLESAISICDHLNLEVVVVCPCLKHLIKPQICKLLKVLIIVMTSSLYFGSRLKLVHFGKFQDEVGNCLLGLGWDN